jgi:AP-1 complex subunit beta-1
MEKLEIIIRLAREKNIDQVLLELKEYATEVDVEFVRRSLRAIGRCAIKLERAAERCISVLLDLIQTKVNYVVQEGIVVIKDIFRKYPNRYEGIIATLCENLEDLDEPEAKASMVWIIGEYAERIDNADELLDSFLETFKDETAQVQLQLLTAVVKIFLKQPDTTQEMVQRVLNMATEDSDNPDLRDRGYVYWRLLSSDPEAARAVVLTEKPEIRDDTFTIDPSLLEELVSNIATLSSIYHKPAEAFVMKTISQQATDDDYYDDEDIAHTGLGSDSLPNSGAPAPGTTTSNGGGGDLLDMFGGSSPTPSSGGATDLFGDASVAPSNPSLDKLKTVLLTPEQGKGVAITGCMTGSSNAVKVYMEITNNTSAPIPALAIQLNKNAHGLAPVNPAIPLPSGPIQVGQKVTSTVDLKVTADAVNAAQKFATVQSAIMNVGTQEVCFFHLPTTPDALFQRIQAPDAVTYAGQWKSFTDDMEVSQIVNNLPTTDTEAIKAKLAAVNIVFVALRPLGQGQTSVFFMSKTEMNHVFLIEIKLKEGTNICKVCVKSSSKESSDVVKAAVARLVA